MRFLMPHTVAVRSLLAVAGILVAACSSTPPVGTPGADPVDPFARSSSPTAEVTVDWSYISFTLEGSQLPTKRSHGCQDVRSRRCGTWQLPPGMHTFRVTAGPSASRTESSFSVTVSPPQIISLRLEPGHKYLVQRVRVYDATARLCWYPDNAGAATECRD